jgi:hypothetical protein
VVAGFDGGRWLGTGGVYAGSAAVRMIVDGTGLTARLSRALRRRGFVPMHDRGRVLTDVAVMIADGSWVLSDLAKLRDQGELFRAGDGRDRRAGRSRPR